MTVVREERRLLTCMFVDVVGSTELTVRMGAERLKRELGNAFTEISGIVAAHGGTVEKYVGDAIYALFGAPVAHEDDALRALRTAVALRGWCAAGAAHGHPFAIRVGIETGEAVIDLLAAESTRQQMSVGPVVNIAARLQARADPGDVLVGPTVREAVGDAAELEELGPQDLKGIGSLPVWRLVAVGGARRPSAPFVGRAAEISLLGHAYDRALRGRSVLAVVSGPPGQGKTRLVQEFLRERGETCRVIATRCRPPEETGVFAPVREVLGVATLDELAEQVGRLCTDDVECERLVAGLAESAGITTSRSLAALPAAEREDEIVQAWRSYVGLLGADRLVILAIDDIHWADTSLVRLVDRLTFGGPRALVIATARPEFAEAAGVRPSGDRFFIELEGLDADEARRLARVTGRDDDRVIERAEGNPLFLIELARAGADAAELPLTLQGALGAHLDQLAPEDRTLLSLAAVAGDGFAAADAAFLAKRDLAKTGRALTRLVDLHFLDLSEKGYRFHHGLVREVAYGRLLVAERMRAHALFARERVHPEDAETLAHHWWEALRPPDADWIWAAEPEELRAMRREAHAAHLAAARANADHFVADRATLLAERALQLADDDRGRAAAYQAIGLAHHRVLREDEAWSHLQRAVEHYRRAGAVPAALYVDMVHAASYTGAFKDPPPGAEVAALVEAGVAAARVAGDARAAAQIRCHHAAYVSRVRAAEIEEVAPYVDAAVAAADASGDAESWRGALELKLGLLMGAGRLDEVAPLIDEARRAGREGDALERLFSAMRRAVYHVAMGDRAADEEAVAEGIALAEPMGAHNRTHAWQQAAEMHAARGEWDKVIDLAQRTAKLIGEPAGSRFCTLAAAILSDGAIAHALAGAREEALALLRLIPLTSDPEPELRAMVPRALLGFAAPEVDAKLAEKRRTWWAWAYAAMRFVIQRRPDDAEAALARIGRAAETAGAISALAEGVREAVAEMRGGPPATYEALRRIGYLGWIEILERRVDAEY